MVLKVKNLFTEDDKVLTDGTIVPVYNDKDKTIKPENFTQKISKRVSRTEVGRQSVKKFVKP